MSFFKRSKRSRTVTFVTIAALSALFFGCAVMHDDGDASESEIKGSLAQAKACAIKARYQAAELTDFVNLEFSDLPHQVQAATPEGGDGSAYARLAVPGVGNVFVVNIETMTSFYSPAGVLLAQMHTFGISDEWFMSMSTGPSVGDASFSTRPLVCAGPSIDAGRRDGSIVAHTDASVPPDATPPPPADASPEDPPPVCTFCD